MEVKELKLCKYCNQELSLDCFRHNRCKCKECEKLYGRTYRQSNSGKQKAKEWSNNNKDKHKKLQSEWTKNNREHLNKNNKIIYSQLLTHSDNIINFHIKNDINIDKKYFQLLARHLKSSGNSLEF